MSKSSAKSEWAPNAPTPVFLRSKEVAKTIKKWVFEWEGFYRKKFKMSVDLSGVNIVFPEDPEFTRLIIVAQGLTMNRGYDVCAEYFPCWCYVDDLDKAITSNDRTVDKSSYAVWFRDRKEADEELKNLSANQLAEKKIPGITLLERLLYELKYWDETGEHLDVSSWTLCTGSRDSDGPVPLVGWHGDRLRVDWDYPGGRFGDLRSRAAVPCPSKAN